MIMESMTVSGAKQGAALTQANQPKWDAIPGEYGLGIFWNHFMYNCTNVWDVVFKNQMPSFMEFGPYIYQESDTYTDLNWTNRKNNLTGIQQDTVLATFNQDLTYKSAGDIYLDTPMWLVNQAAIGTWWGANNADAWRVYLTVMYNVVNVGLGAGVQNLFVYDAMS